MIGKYLNYIGLRQRRKSVTTGADTTDQMEGVKPDTYKHSTDIAVIQRYYSYLKEIHDYQKERRSTIENKNSQLVGQASIVTSIFALIIPLLFDNLKSAPLLIHILLSMLFLVVLFHYIFSIMHATKTLTVNKYQYPGRSTSTITKKDRKENEVDFMNAEIEDMVYIINHTTPIDNIKGDNLIYGARCFKIGNIGFGVMTFFVVFFLLLMPKNALKTDELSGIELGIQITDTLKLNLHDAAPNSYRYFKILPPIKGKMELDQLPNQQ